MILRVRDKRMVMRPYFETSGTVSNVKGYDLCLPTPVVHVDVLGSES